MMGIIDKCGVRGDATLCVVIFYIYYIFITFQSLLCGYYLMEKQNTRYDRKVSFSFTL